MMYVRRCDEYGIKNRHARGDQSLRDPACARSHPLAARQQQQAEQCSHAHAHFRPQQAAFDGEFHKINPGKRQRDRADPHGQSCADFFFK